MFLRLVPIIYIFSRCFFSQNFHFDRFKFLFSMASNVLRREVLKSFKTLHRTRKSIFKNNAQVLETVRQEINEKYKQNKEVSGKDSIEELIKFASDVTHELRTTVAEFEEVGPGRYRLKLRPEMFEEQENLTPKKLSK